MVQTRDFGQESYDLVSGPPAVQMGLGDLVERWSDAGASLPVAVVVSILDDVLAAHPSENFMTRPRALGLEDILLDEYGQAHLLSPGRLSCSELSNLLRSLLIGGFGDYGIPPAAHMLLSQLGTDELWQTTIDADGLRHRIRASLGAPASRGEVGACVLQLVENRHDTDFGSDWNAVNEATVQLSTQTPSMSSIEEDVNLESLAATKDVQQILDFVDDSVEYPTEDLPGLTPSQVVSQPPILTDEQACMDILPSSASVERDDQTDNEEAQAIHFSDSDSLEPEQNEVLAPPPMPDPTDDLLAAKAYEAKNGKEELLEVPELVADEPDSDDICVTNYPEPDYYLDQDAAADNDKPPSLLPRVRGGTFKRPTWKEVTREKSQPDSPSQIPRVRILPTRRRPLTLPAAPPARLRTTSTGPADSMISLPRKDSPALWVGLICVSLVVGALIYSMTAI